MVSYKMRTLKLCIYIQCSAYLRTHMVSCGRISTSEYDDLLSVDVFLYKNMRMFNVCLSRCEMTKFGQFYRDVPLDMVTRTRL